MKCRLSRVDARGHVIYSTRVGDTRAKPQSMLWKSVLLLLGCTICTYVLTRMLVAVRTHSHIPTFSSFLVPRFPHSHSHIPLVSSSQIPSFSFPHSPHFKFPDSLILIPTFTHNQLLSSPIPDIQIYMFSFLHSPFFSTRVPMGLATRHCRVTSVHVPLPSTCQAVK